MKRWVKALVGFGLVGCAKAVPAPVSAPSNVLVSTPAPRADLAERGSFGSAALPPSAMLWCHVPAPARDLPVLAQLTNLGPLLDPSELLAQRLGAALAGELDLKRAVDLVVLSSNGDDWAPVGAVGVADAASFAARTQADFDLVRVAAARWSLVPKRSAVDLAAKCELWQAPAPVGARVICAEATSSIEQAGAFMMGAARATASSSLHLEMPAPALTLLLKKSEAEQKQAKEPQSASERAGDELGRGLVKQFTDAVDGLSWDITLHDKFVDVAQEFRFQKSEALLPLVMSGRSGPHPIVPDALWRLPPDSALALYSEGADKEPLRKAWATWVPSFVQGIELDDIVTPAQLSEFEQALESTIFRGGAWELAYGQDLTRSAEALDEGAKRLGPGASKANKGEAELTRVSKQLGGWFVLGLEDDPRALLDSLRHAVTIGSKSLVRRKDALPEKPSPSDSKTREAALKNPSALPPGAVHFVYQSQPNKKYVPPADGSKPAPAPSTIHLIAVPEGGQLWISAAHDEATATSRLRALLAAEPNQALGADAALRELAATPPSGLGFTTIAGFVGLSLSASSAKELADSRKALSNLLVSPGKGETRMPVWITADGGGATPRRISYNVRLPPGAIADLLHLALTSAGGSE